MVSEVYTVHIKAPPQKIWETLIDVERWPEWAESVQAVERLDGGDFGLDCEARLRVKGAPVSVWTVTEFTPGNSFSWQTNARGVESMAEHRVEAEGEGSRLTLATVSRGLLATVFSPLIRRVARRNLQLEAEGLKRRCEGEV